MKAINDNNRYYCHRKITKGIRKGRIIFLPFNETPDKYALRLQTIYNYSIQLIINDQGNL